MSNERHRSVAFAPSKPLLIFDGDCHFCRRWIERWRELTGETVEYAPYQEVAGRFPEISREEFESAVQLVDADGAVYQGAEAVFRALGHRFGCRWMVRAYERLWGFAAITDAAYRQVARNRGAASFVTRLLWGEDVRRPTYFWSRFLFLRGLGLIYLVAFVSLWVQVDGLIGENGILPVKEYLSAMHEQLGVSWPELPTLCWWNSSNGFLHFLCGAGVVTSVLLIVGVAPVASLILLLALYLSLTVAGQTFLSFQWDILLLETGFLAIFFAPVRLWPRTFPWRSATVNLAPVSGLGLFLLKLLLFKLMLMSGVVKLTSGDDSWWNLTALDYHYETQPLPTVLGWWAHQTPDWFRKFSTFFVLFVETVVPFFIWTPRRLRHCAAGLFILLQIFIALTGNYCFFNLLTIVLTLLLIDDTYWGARLKGKRQRETGPQALPGRPTGSRSFRYILGGALLIVLLPINATQIVSAFNPQMAWPSVVQTVYRPIEPFRILNGYGLFRVMTKSRPEILLEGSNNGEEWLPYEFKWKPGDVNRSPGWVAPHQPRLDWQMWFAALGTYRHNPWFLRFEEALLRNNPAVTSLLRRNPFPDGPPRYLRATLYDYKFTTVQEKRATGAWWKREERGEYVPAISLGSPGN